LTADVAPRRSPTPPSPTRSQSMQLRWRAVERSGVLPVVVAAVLSLLLGAYVGRATAPAVDDTALAAIEREVIPLVVDADAIWTAGSDGSPGVGRQLQAMRLEDDPAAVAPHVSDWLEAYDIVLRRIVGVEVGATVRPVQRQLVAAVTLSRDAVELIGEAADAGDPATRRDLTSEAIRLRIRAEQLTQNAQASLTDLRGATTSGVAVPPSLPAFSDLR
jgi:hypothetical protein